MLLALLLLSADLSSWVPMRSPDASPAVLELIRDTPVNCLVIPATAIPTRIPKGLHIAASVITQTDVDLAISKGAEAIVLEGYYEPDVAAALSKRLPVIGLSIRGIIDPSSPVAVHGSNKGVWPGINAVEDAHAAPSGAPWIDTNSGFLRFLRAASDKPAWIAISPPEKSAVTTERYLQAIGDAGMIGARWVISLDADFRARLLARDAKALAGWKRITEALAYYEAHKDWAGLPPFGKLAVVQDVDSGGLLSGGVLDMIAVKHTPVRPVPARSMTSGSFTGAKMAVNVAPDSLSADQKAVLRDYTRAGGTLLSAPPGWKMPVPRPDQITIEKADYEKLDLIWKEVNSMTGRANLGARLFNVSSMLSNLSGTPDGSRVVLQLVNYSEYPAEDITVHMLGKFTKARLFAPGQTPVDLKPFETDEGTGVEIARISAIGTIEFSP